MTEDGSIKDLIRRVMKRPPDPTIKSESVDVEKQSVADDYQLCNNSGWRAGAYREIEAALRHSNTRLLIEHFTAYCGADHYRILNDNQLTVCRQMIRQEKVFNKMGLSW